MDIQADKNEELNPLNFGEPSLFINVRGKNPETLNDTISTIGAFTQIVVHDIDTDKKYVYEKDTFCDLLAEVVRLQDELEEWKTRYAKDFDAEKNTYDIAIEDSGVEELRVAMGQILDKLEEARNIAWRPFRNG